MTRRAMPWCNRIHRLFLGRTPRVKINFAKSCYGDAAPLQCCCVRFYLLAVDAPGQHWRGDRNVHFIKLILSRVDGFLCLFGGQTRFSFHRCHHRDVGRALGLPDAARRHMCAVAPRTAGGSMFGPRPFRRQDVPRPFFLRRAQVHEVTRAVLVHPTHGAAQAHDEGRARFELPWLLRRTIPMGSPRAAFLRFQTLVLQSGSQNVATGGPRVAGSRVLAMRAQQEPQQAPGPGTKVMALPSDYVHVKPGFLGACYFNKFK